MNDSREQLSNLSAEQRALLLLRLKKQKEQEAKKEEQAITRQSRDSNEFPLSVVQQGIWFLEQFEKDNIEYNVATAFSLVGQLQVTAFENSVNEIIKRHEILRTTFKVVDGQPIQVISSALTIPLSRIDLTHLPKDEQTVKIKQLSEEEIDLPFDLIGGPLIRVSLLQLESEYHVFFLTLHHIVYDAWSRSIFYKELSELYAANVKGTSPKLQDLEIQYADFASWQNQQLESELFARQLGYWKQHLRGAPAEIGLLTDRPRAYKNKLGAEAESFSLTPELTARIKALASQAGTTMFSVFFSVYALLLSRYCGHQDIVVGVPVANRKRKELERLIGLFVNSIVVRVDLSGSINFLQLLERTNQAAQEGFDNQDIPFKKLVEEIHPDRNLKHTPIFQVMFNMLSASGKKFNLEGLTVNHLKLRDVTAGTIYDLTFTIEEDGERIKGVAEYNADLFDSATISRMVGNFQTLLEGCLENPQLPVETIPILTSSEKNQILREWNDTEVFYNERPCLHELYEVQAEKSPDSLAISFCGEELSYKELNQRSNQLAHHLLNLGVGKEAIVGILLDRSPDMIIAVLGVLKAGCAYLPMDPYYPQSRLAFMQEDSQVAAVLTQAKYMDTVPIVNDRIVCMDADSKQISNENKNNPDCAVDPGDLAYVIYTSGTTGKPKGVLGVHRAVVNLLNFLIEEHGMTKHDIVFSINNFSFDPVIIDFYLPLVSGASIVLADPDILNDGRRLLSTLQNSNATFMDATPATWRMLVDEGWEKKLPLKITCGGEALPRKLADQLLDRCDALWNCYGPTECTVQATLARIKSKAAPVSIGKPIANTQIYILDPNFQPVPVGVPGELHIGGKCMTRGYLNRADLTEEKFIRNPFSDQSESRLYKTGDLARFLADGTIEFLGRIDNQVKIRGYRVEPGEVESVLRQHKSVRDCVVVPRENISGTDSLIGYVVPEPDYSVTAGDLSQFLRDSLPQFMVPSIFMFIQELPLTSVGKVDRKALPAPDYAGASLGTEYMAPRTELEQQLAQIWAEVLKLERIGVHDNFFDLGGHSLLVTQAVSRIREQLNVELPLSDIFDSPTVAQVVPIIESLRAECADGSAQIIVPAPRDGELQLSFPQQRLWFLDQLEPGSSAYNIPDAIKLRGKLDIKALRRSLQEIVNRHEVLRTSFRMKDGQAVQEIAAALELELPVEDLSAVAESERSAQLRWILSEDALQPFNLVTGPVIRFRLLRLGEDEHVLMLTMHHIASDEWSRGILFRELGALYAAFCHGQPSPLPALPVQYVDFAVWQREWLSSEVLGAQLDYWKAQLAGVDNLQLPADRPRPAVQTYAGARVSLKLSQTLSEQLEKFTKKQGVTTYMTLLAAFSILLKRYCCQDDIVVGTPIANRNHREIEDLIGFFLNTLVIRIDVSGDPTFGEFLSRVKQTAIDAYEHQDLPFEILVDELQPERDRSRNPVFQVLFTMQNAPAQGLLLEGLTAEKVSAGVKSTRFDLEAYISKEPQNFHLNFIYNTDLFDAETIERMLGHYQTLLEQIATNPACRIEDLRLLSETEYRQAVVEWNRTELTFPTKAQTVHQLFEDQVEQTPEAFALEFEGQSLSYRELNARANRLAHYLREHGVGPDSVVGICLERGHEAVTAVLAALKAGGGYTPLNPSYPEERLGFMLQTSQAAVLVTKSDLAQKFPTCEALHICLDEDMPWSGYPAQNPEHETRADHTAYVIFTSGSTGRPKGIVMPHRVLCNLLQWQLQRFRQVGGARTLQFSSFSFDVSFQEMFSTLCAGDTLILVSEALRRDPEQTLNFLDEARIDRLFTPFAGLNQLAEASFSSGCVPGHLQEIITAGEALQVTPALEHLFEQLGDCTLDNQYGPSETHVVTANRLTGNAREWPRLPAIGRPIANAKIFLLDDQLRPVPVGVPGEMYIGGDCLAHGYIGQPALTEERFIRSPFGESTDARLYRTGDMARYGADGSIEFLGRIDSQVKVRGYRIELGEIEAVIMEQADVKACVAMVREDEPGDKRIAAYVVLSPEWIERISSSHSGEQVDKWRAQNEETFSTNPPEGGLGNELVPQLRQALKRQLPEYMLPSVYVVLDALPLNPNGKVDRKALPVPSDVRATLGTEYTAPRTELEQQLGGIWAEVLKLEQVGVHDNFFDLGGHSLMATQVVSRIRGQLNVELPLSEMFGYPTVAELALVLESLLEESGVDEAGMIPVVDREGDLPLSFAQERLWFLHQLEPESTAYNLPLALRLKGELRVDALLSSLKTIIDRHEALRTHFPAHRGRPIQVVDEVIFELQQEDLSALPSDVLEGEVKARVDAEALQPFDLSTGPLLHGKLLRLSDQEHVLMLTMHHIISDGWSLGVLSKELGKCYAAYSEGNQPELAELPIQYADFAVWQRQWLTGEQLDRQLGYWSKQLADLPVLDLPTDGARPAIQSYDGAVEVLFIDKRLSEQLERLSKDSGVTLFMTVFAAYVVLLHRYSGQDDIVIGSPIANRNRAELEGLIAFFVNMLVMRIDCSGWPGFKTLLKRVNGVTLGAYEHQDIPFERLVDVLRVERDPSRNPLFQVQFSLQNAPQDSFDLSGLTLEPISSDLHFSRFDLECHVWNKPQGLQLIFVYNTNLFDKTTIQGMQKHFANLLAAVVEDPDKPIDLLPMLSGDERHLLLERWNQTVTDYPRYQTVHALFEEQVSRTPDSIAVSYEGKTLSYSQLNERANKVAHYLQARGVSPDVMVGICVERSLEMAIGLLGIVKAGGAYLPLDPEYPESRLGFMLEDARIKLILTTSSQRQSIPTFPGDTICLDTDWVKIEQEKKDNPASGATADSLIYAIYTSGSTGRPKGTLIEHRSAVRLVKESNFFELGLEDVILQFAPIAFDASTFEIWGSLLNGARLVIYPSERSSLEELGQVIRGQGVTTLWLTSALFNQMVDNHLDSLSGVKQLLTGGEALSPPHVKKMLAHLDGGRLINGYGPTENTTFTCCHVMTGSSELEQSVPIGRPISNTTVYVLDRRMQPVPIGVPGELYTGGDGLARGYLNQPEMTEERFVVNPFSDDPHARLYATGDQVRYRSDGAIEFIGRIDSQVKIRGFRIELGEIETVLSRHEHIKDCAVLVYEDSQENKNIAAYFLSDNSFSTLSLRNFLRKKLPQYMIPTVLTKLDAMPVTPNGKTDYKTLASYTQEKTVRDSKYLAPETHVEKKIAGIWETMLNVDQIGVGDNFFDIGGHSLLLLQAKSAIEIEVGVSVPVMDFFYQTLGQIAAYCEKNQPFETSREEV